MFELMTQVKVQQNSHKCEAVKLKIHTYCYLEFSKNDGQTYGMQNLKIRY